MFMYGSISIPTASLDRPLHSSFLAKDGNEKSRAFNPGECVTRHMLRPVGRHGG